jgi:hypothetical protein
MRDREGSTPIRGGWSHSVRTGGRHTEETICMYVVRLDPGYPKMELDYVYTNSKDIWLDELYDICNFADLFSILNEEFHKVVYYFGAHRSVLQPDKTVFMLFLNSNLSDL